MAGLPLITGATGFAGGHLLEQLSREGAVHAWSNPNGRHGTGAPGTTARWRAVDLLDRKAVRRALDETRPAAIYHCAGVADVHSSWNAPTRALRVNVRGTHNLIDAVAALGLEIPVLISSSSHVYRPSLEAISEETALGPTSPYGLSKLAQEMAATASGSTVLIARAFNHAGPRQEDAYVTSAFARQIAEIEAGLTPPVLRVGNLDTRRDITDVRDTVKAYRDLISSGEPGVPYNICCGTAYRVRDLLDILLSLARISVRLETDPARLRPSDNPVSLGSHARITRRTGWEPEIPIERTLADLLDDWRRRVATA